MIVTMNMLSTYSVGSSYLKSVSRRRVQAFVCRRQSPGRVSDVVTTISSGRVPTFSSEASHGGRRWKSTEASASTAAMTPDHVVKSNEKQKTNKETPSGPSPPGPSKLDCVRSLVQGDFGNTAYLKQLRLDYGDVVSTWGFQSIHHVFDPEIFMSILRQEWSLPHGAAPHIWPFRVYYRHKSPDVFPMSMLQGEEWRKPRHTIQTHMFSPQAADSFQPGINQVVEDAAEYLRKYDPCPEDFNQFLMNVSFEMLAQVLLDRRMGLVSIPTEKDDHSMADEHQFVTSAVDSFHALGVLLLKPEWSNLTLLRCLPVWNKFERNTDQVWDIGMRWLKEAEEAGSEVAFVNKLAGQGKMERQERLVNLLTLLQAGVDTTSNSLAWTLYELAKRPEIQEKLRQELRQALEAEDGAYHRKHMSKLPYLKAVMREIQRFTPAAAGTLRRLPFDVQAGDYVLEEGSLIFWNQEPYSSDPELLGGDPDEFVPERWLAAEELSKRDDDLHPRRPVKVDGFDDVLAPAPILSHPLMTTAFSVGPRMCVGARIAQNEIHSVVAKLCYDFVFYLDPPDQKVERVQKLLMTPDPAPRIRFDAIAK